MDPVISQFNAYGSAGTPPFLFNQTYDLAQSNEANLYLNIYSEYVYLHGWNISYLPREVNLEETTFGEYLAAVYNQGINMRILIDEREAWSGAGDMYSKFGLQVTDECTVYCDINTFSNATSGLYYPKQGDLIYVEKSQKLFQVSHVENEAFPGFYFLGNRPSYKIDCKLFQYNHEFISQAASSNIPDAIQALDALLQNTVPVDPSGDDQVSIDQKEFDNNNLNIQTGASSVIDTTEEDPLVG